MDQPTAPENRVRAVRLENFRTSDWGNSVQWEVRSRYPGMQTEYLNPRVILLHLNTSTPWGEQDEAFFAGLQAREFFQRWEPLHTVPPAPKANKAVYEDIGYRIGEQKTLTPKQQEALLSQLHDLEHRAQVAERERDEQRKRADIYEEANSRLTERHNRLVGLVETVNEILGIKVDGDFVAEPCIIEDRRTGQILARDVDLRQAYPSLMQRAEKRG